MFERRGSLADEEIHDILRNTRRRAVLQTLRETVGTTSLRELSVSIAERESGESPPPSDIRESVYNSLHQTHLPKLDRDGVINYDRDRKTVELDNPAREVDVYMEIVSPYGVTWASFYRTLCTVALTGTLLAHLDVGPFVLVNELILITIFLGVLAVSASYQLWNHRWFVLRALVD